jgi:hypothetical protein
LAEVSHVAAAAEDVQQAAGYEHRQYESQQRECGEGVDPLDEPAEVLPRVSSSA